MKYIDKRFLSNICDETGSMVCKVVCPDSVSGMSSWEALHSAVEGQVEVRDCHGKPVWLDFSIDKDHSLAQRLEKLDLMIEMLTHMKGALSRAHSEAARIGEEWKELNPDKLKESDDEIFR